MNYDVNNCKINTRPEPTYDGTDTRLRKRSKIIHGK